MANRFQLWGQAGWASAEVVGETHYAKAIRALFGSTFDPKGTDITIPVQLIPDRSNRHDRNAVGVWSGSSLLGHLPRPEAARYVQVLTSLTTRGLVPEVNARIHGREWGEYDGRPPAFDATIRLDLAEPHLLVPANTPPAQEHRVLPTGSAVQVNGQQPFLDVLRPLLRREGECWAYVTLHEMADHLVEVRIGDARVGDLSPKMSGELLPALRHLAEQGLITAARAIVKGYDNKAEVMLYVARGHDLPESLQGTAARQAAVAAVSPGAPGASAFAPAGSGPSGFAPAASDASVPAPAGSAGSGVFQGGSAAAGRAPAGFPHAGVATTGPATNATAPGSAAPGPAGTSAAAPGWASPDEPVPSWAALAETTPNESSPSWAGASDTVPGWSASGEQAGLPSWAVPSGGVPSWAVSSSNVGLPTLPSTGALPGGSAPRLDPPPPDTGFSPPAEASGAVGNSWLDRAGAAGSASRRGAPAGSVAVTEPVAPIARPQDAAPSPSPSPSPVSGAPASSHSGDAERAEAPSFAEVSAAPPFTGPPVVSGGALPSADPSSHPVSPAAPDGATIAETTVLPALAAVVSGNAGRRIGVAPVSPASDGNPHPPIPAPPTGIRFAVPPGWPVPPAGWFPPPGWRPDPGWPLAPAGWQWWVPTWD